MAVIEIEGLRKEYRRFRRSPQVAVGGLDLSVPSGGVYGFLGPNGSGKTTTIRCALGLVRPSAGRVRVLGTEVSGSPGRALSRVGSLVESPVAFPNFSARRNLSILARAAGIGASRVEEVLGVVGLADRAGDPVRAYSLGMRQRLGVATALLKDPELLILDEPANGLDPAGIREMRELVRRLGAEGRTVFVSSHLLAEVQQMCDRVAILTRGRCIAEGTVADVLRGGTEPRLVVEVGSPEPARAILADAGYAVTLDGATLLVDAPASAAAAVNRTLAEQGVYLTGLRTETADLEQVFLDLTADPVASEDAS